MPQVPSSRWCPTAEQLTMLEEMYRAGLRTPNALQIQSITSHLSLYGKIEGKNVFYWFQNHKARDRQKLRKKLFRQHHHLAHHASLFPISAEAPFSLPFPPSSQGVREEIAHAMGKRGKIERDEDQQRSTEMSAMASNYEWKMLSAGAPSSCRPLRTLDLFPTRITGIRTDDVASNSSTD